MTRRLGMFSPASAAARSRSISTATTCLARLARGRVSAPRPGPISRKVSSGPGSIASTTLATHTGSRKCWPNRFRGLLILLAAPVPLLDFLNLFFAQTEVVTHLMDQRLADDRAHVIVALAVFFDRLLKNGDAVREGVAVAPRALGQRCPLIETVQRVGRLDLHLFEQFRARFLLDDHCDVPHLPAETSRDERDRLSDEAFESFSFHGLQADLKVRVDVPCPLQRVPCPLRRGPC